MKALPITIMLAVAIVCFVLSGIMLMGTELVSQSGELDEYKATQLLAGLDQLPGVYIDMEDVVFSTRGTITELSRESVVIDQEIILLDGAVPDVKTGELAIAEYRYNTQGQKTLAKMYVADETRDCQKHIYDYEQDKWVHACPVTMIYD